MIKYLHSRLRISPLPIWGYGLVSAAVLTIAYNTAYIRAVTNYAPLSDSSLILKLGALLFFLNYFVINIFSFNRLTNGFVAFCILAAAGANYFFYEYGTLIDKSMIENAIETDIGEISGLLNIHLFAFIFFLGILPAIIAFKFPIRHQKGLCLLKSWSIRVLISLLLVLLVVFSSYKELSSFFRSHRDTNQLATPLNVITAVVATTRLKLKEWQTSEFIDLTADTHQLNINADKPKLVVLVVGETARADHFGLNGYSRNTTPRLNQRNIVNFESVSSCGTATAVSLPCMFSLQNRSGYDELSAKNSSNLLDFITKSGIFVLWKDNNSGCKEVCDRIPNEFPRKKLTNSSDCSGNNCNDIILLDGFDNSIESMPRGNKVIVLHQMGSHGPEYFRRSNNKQKVFQPECKTSDLQACTQAEIVNAYDNSIVATDYFLDLTISKLEKLSHSYDTALIYVSDHGESLGENGLYLHGLPYFIAPQAQTHVPMLLWMSEEFQADRDINLACLKSDAGQAISHDNLFHSILGLMEITDPHYQSNMDIFLPCSMSNRRLTSAMAY